MHSVLYLTLRRGLRGFVATYRGPLRLRIIRQVAAQGETISYRMPAFKLNGMLIYFAAFKKHIGLFPPVRGNDDLMQAVKPYAEPKGNLQFPYKESIPYALIQRIVKARALMAREKGEPKRRPP